MSTSEQQERGQYHVALYRVSEKHRLARINHTRRRRGVPEAESLEHVALRIPVGR